MAGCTAVATVAQVNETTVQKCCLRLVVIALVGFIVRITSLFITGITANLVPVPDIFLPLPGSYF